MQNIIDYIPLFETFMNQTLIIVDVQEPYKKFWVKNGNEFLVNKIMDYAKQFHQVIQVYDTNNQSTKSYDFPNTVKEIEKKFGGSYDHPVEGIIWDGSKYVVHVKGSHEWFFPSKDMVETFQAINTPIVLVGGAENECLYDIEVLLALLGKQFTTNHSYTFHA